MSAAIRMGGSTKIASRRQRVSIFPTGQTTQPELLAYAKNRFNRLHDRNCWMRDAVILHLFQIFLETLDINNRVVSLAVIVATQPKGNIIRVRNCIAPELLAGNLGDIDCDLRLRGRYYKKKGYQAQILNHGFRHDLFP